LLSFLCICGKWTIVLCLYTPSCSVEISVMI
jgi:hypothetical protein